MWPFGKKDKDTNFNEATSDAKSTLAAQMMVGIGDLGERPRGESLRTLDEIISLMNEAAKLTSNPKNKAMYRKSAATAKSARKWVRKNK